MRIDQYDVDPRDVAAWIADTALAENSPATITDTAPGRAAAIVRAAYPLEHHHSDHRVDRARRACRQDGGVTTAGAHDR